MCLSANARHTLLASLALALPLGTVGAAESTATLSRLVGVGVVSQGAQYVPAHEGMALRQGDRFMVLEDGNAIITFADGCRYSLADNEVLTIGATNTCTTGAVGSHEVTPHNAVAGDYSSAATDVQLARAIGAGTVPGTSSIPSWAVPAVGIGGLAILGTTFDTGSSSGGGSTGSSNVAQPPSP
jgi:hypothetical protein